MARPPIADDNGEDRPDTPAADTEPGPDSTNAGTAAAEPRRRQTPAPKPRRAASLPWLLSGVLLVLVAAGGAYLTWPLWKQDLPGYLRIVLEPVMQAGRDAGLQRRVAAIDKRLAEVESQIMLMRETLARSNAAGGDKAAAARARLAARLGAVEESLAQLKPAVGGGPRLAPRLDRLQAEVAKLRAAGGDGGAETAATAALARRLDALDRKVSALAARAGAVGGESPALGALRVENNETFIALRRGNQALSATVAALTRRLAALEARPAAPAVAPPPATGDGGLLLAVGQLRDALRGSGPYTGELAAVRAIGAGDKAVEKAVAALAPDAARGVASRVALHERFQATTVAVARAALAPEGSGWWDQTLARLSRVITYRRTGTGAADSKGATGLLARAEGRMSAADLAGAVAALDGLEGAAAEEAAGWLRDAHRRLDAENALAALTTHAIARLDAGRAGDATGG